MDDKDFTTSSQLEQKLSHALSPSELGKAFVSAAKESKSIDLAIRDILIDQLKSNTDVAIAPKEVIEKHNNDVIKSMLGKIFPIAVSLVSVSVGALIKYLLDK